MNWNEYKKLRSAYEELVGKKFSGVIPEARQYPKTQSEINETKQALRSLQRAAGASRVSRYAWRDGLLTSFGDLGAQQLVRMKRIKHDRITNRKLAREANRRYLAALEWPFLTAHASTKLIAFDTETYPLVSGKPTHATGKTVGKETRTKSLLKHFQST